MHSLSKACPSRIHQFRSRPSTNMAFSLSPKTRLIITISISFAFFVAEITGSSTPCAVVHLNLSWN